MAHKRRAPAIRQKQWDDIHPTFRELYIDEEKPLREVIAILEKTMGFKATLKQYKTYIHREGLSKYNKTGPSLTSSNPYSRMPDKICTCMASHVCTCNAIAPNPTPPNLTSENQSGQQNYGTGVAEQFSSGRYIHGESLATAPNSPLQSMFDSWSVPVSQPVQKTPASEMFSDATQTSLVSGSTLSQHTKTINIDFLFGIPQTRWQQGHAHATDILEIRNLAMFFTAARSHKDAYRLGWETLVQSLTTDNQTTEHISQTILDTMHNCKHLYGAKKARNLLNMTTFWSPKPEERSLASCLLRSCVGDLLFELGDFQSALDICDSTMTQATSLWSENVLSWRYRCLTRNLSRVCQARQKEGFDDVVAWRQYLDAKHRLRTTIVDHSIDTVLQWCFAMLDLPLFWTVFQDSDERAWTTASKVTNADFAEFESSVLFCFFWHSWKNQSLIPDSGLSWSVDPSLWSVCNTCDMLPVQLFATISYLIAHSQCEQEGRKYKSNLPRRARSQILQLHNISTPTPTLENACWSGSSFTVALLETHADMQFRPHRFSRVWYRQLVNSFVRDFANENCKIALSQDALRSMTELPLQLPDLFVATTLPSPASSRSKSGNPGVFANNEVSNINFEDLQSQAFLRTEPRIAKPLFEILVGEKVSNRWFFTYLDTSEVREGSGLQNVPHHSRHRSHR